MPDALPSYATAPVNVTQATAFVVVSFWQPKSGSAEGSYEYEQHGTLNDALDAYREYEDGEYARARAIGIFAAQNGMPVGGRLDPVMVLRLMAETRAGRPA